MINSIAAHILALPGWVALLVVFLVPALESSAFVGIVFPGEVALILGGVLANQGRVSLSAVLLAGITGAVVGDSVGYAVGRRWGRKMVDGSMGRLVKAEHLDRGERYLRTRGGKAVFLGRFTAALRVTIPGLAGMSRLPYPTFLAYNVAGGVLWGTLVVMLGYLAGSSWHQVEHLASRIGLAALGVVLVAALATYLVRSRGGPAQSLARRLGQGMAEAPLVRRTRTRYPRATSWIADRFDPTCRSGLALTAVVAAAAALGWVFLGVTQDVVAHEELARIDPTIHAYVLQHRSAGLTASFRVVTWFGSGVVTLPALAIAGVLLARAERSWRPLVELAAVYLTAALAHAVVAEAVRRPRPPQADWLAAAHGWSYPSGHTTQAVAAWGILALVAARHASRRGRIALGVSAVSIAALVGASRVYLGMHWATDVIGATAMAATLLAAWAAVRLSRARSPS
ncbi:MAG: bifunctional DedA family/phosphatase PAP2 family protein [Nocardioidaceae bacterium]